MTQATPRKQTELRKLPGVDLILDRMRIQACIGDFGHAAVVSAIRHVLDDARQKIRDGSAVPTIEAIEERVASRLETVFEPSLKRVINATGVLIHTNLGRAPLGETVAQAVHEVMVGYSNLEMDLDTGRRGHRDAHLADLLSWITAAESALVVNNNAAGILLVLNTLAAGKEVIISRGELIEIGGSFRIPDIMAASGARMVEVGTTNKTHRSDYEAAINDQTALLFKVHKSNYEIRGFTDEVSVKELTELARAHQLPLVYDIGSGLLRKPENLALADEPDVRSALADGADLVTFSGDKLLGGPQAGIVAGRADLVARLAQAPMKRAVRVGKLTIAALHCVIRAYLNDRTLRASLPAFAMLEQSESTLLNRAQRLAELLSEVPIEVDVVESTGQCGGGTLPNLMIQSFAVMLSGPKTSRKNRALFAEDLFTQLLHATPPVVGVLRGGRFILDVLTIQDNDLPEIVNAVARSIAAGSKS